jgi:pre-rRNA-processing protein TSR3
MQLFPPTLILRHRRENLKKCSLRGLELRSDFKFFSYPTKHLPEAPGYILLALDAPPLTKEDQTHGLFILDGTWRYAEKMKSQVEKKGNWIFRSIPRGAQTAYPRRQEDCLEPDRGLASIEAIYLAYYLLGRDLTGLLDNYFWKDLFLEKNKLFLDFYRY